MTINNKILGIAGIIGSPFLAAEMISGEIVKSAAPQVTTGWGAFFDLIYMLGWMCSIYALLRAGAAGEQGWTRRVLQTQLIILTIANIYNIWGITGKGTDTLLFQILDLSWPLSNAFMLVTGIAIIKADILTGWRRYTPLIVGLWLPIAMTGLVIMGRTPGSLYFGLAYSVIAWGLMGFAAFKTKKQELVYNQFGYPKLMVVHD